MYAEKPKIVTGVNAPQDHHGLPFEVTKDSLPVEDTKERVGVLLKPKKTIGEMNFAYFDDEEINRVILGKLMTKKGLENITVFDTSSNKISDEETHLIKMSDVVITDVNDRGLDFSGGIRRGEEAFKKEKIVIFVTANSDNEAIIHEHFSERYGGRYAFFMKPYSIEDIHNAVQRLTGAE